MTRNEYLSGGAYQSALRGEKLPQSKLDAEKVRAIRLNRHGKTAKDLAAEYGVHIRTIDKVRDRRSWAHIV